MKKISENTKKGLRDSAGKKDKIIETSESRADLKLAEVAADIVPVQENLTIQAELPIKEVSPVQAEIVDNTAGVTSVDSGYAADLSNPMQLADASGVTGDYIQLADAAGGAVNEGSTNTSDSDSDASPVLSSLSDNWHYLAGWLAAVGAGIGIGAANNGGNGDSSGSNPSGPAEVPEITGITTDSGLVGDHVTSDNTPMIKGTAGHNESVKVYIDGEYKGEAIADAEGNWSFDYTGTALSDGHHIFKAQSNGVTFPDYEVTIDTAAPVAPTVSLLNDSGSSNTDLLTNDATLNIGNLETGATVEYSTNGTDWSSAVPAWVQGSNTVSVRQVDVAGNVSDASAPLTFTYDTVAPVFAPEVPVAYADTYINYGQESYIVLHVSEILNQIDVSIDHCTVTNISPVDYDHDGIPDKDSDGYYCYQVFFKDDSPVDSYFVDPNSEISVSIQDVAGNTTTWTHNITVDTANIQLESLPWYTMDGGQGFVIVGESSSDQLGWSESISSAGDVNHDGLDDIIVGARYADASGTIHDSGKSYVVFGKADTNVVDLTSVAAGTGGFVIDGASGGYIWSGRTDATGDQSGYIVHSAGDVNGDGLADLIVGAINADFRAGAAYVVFGKADAGAVELSAVENGTGGFAIHGVTGNGWSGGDYAGWSVSTAGDFNGDGLADLIVGAYGANDNTGKTYLVYGKADTSAVEVTDVEKGIGGFTIFGDNSYDFSGHSVSGAGDINGDGFADLLIGAPAADRTADLVSGGLVINDSGQCYVLFGGEHTSRLADVDILGTSGDDVLAGSTSSETIVAGDGNDIIYGNGGADVLYAGNGNDTIYINADNVTKLAASITDGHYARIDGGGGIDTIRLDGSGITFDLTHVANQGASTPESDSRIESIEKIDIIGSGNNVLTVSINDVLDMSEMNVFNNGNGWSGLSADVDKHQLLVVGNSGDTVNLSGGWVDSGTDATYGGNAYHVYSAIDTNIHVQMLIDNSINQSDIHILA